MSKPITPSNDEHVELPATLMKRMLRGEITAHEAQQEARETAGSWRAANDEIRRQVFGKRGRGEFHADQFLGTKIEPKDAA